MSLRADINSAYDEIAPPAPDLQAEIRRLVASESRSVSRSRDSRLPWVSTFRGSMALVAALLVVIIIATLLVGGRIWHDWNIFNTRPAPAGQSYAVQLAELEARPLQMPLVPLDATCPAVHTISASEADSLPEPIHSLTYAGYVFSSVGPAHASVIPGGGGDLDTWGGYDNIAWVIEPQVTGLVLIRGRDAANHDLPLVYVGQYAAGAVLGTDSGVHGGPPAVQRSEVVLDASHHPATWAKGNWGVYNVRVGIPNGMSGCHVFQVDGEGFSEVFFTHPG
jgi:hypothetical protein